MNEVCNDSRLNVMVENIPPDLKNSEERLKTYLTDCFLEIFLLSRHEELHGMDSIAESYETIQQFEKETMQGTAVYGFAASHIAALPPLWSAWCVRALHDVYLSLFRKSSEPRIRKENC